MKVRFFSKSNNEEEKASPQDLTLGNSLWNPKEQVFLKEQQRPMHIGILGLSGVGKSYFLEHLIRQDIDRKTGFVLFDVHGDLADNVVRYLAERSRTDPDVLSRTILIEPFDPDFTIGFNPLERSSDASPFLQAQELAHILRTRWETKNFGPRTEELLRNALYVLSANNLTLLELPYLLVNQSYRAKLVQTITEQSVSDYWKTRYEKISEGMRAAMREPLLTRVSGFLSDPQIREIVAQPKSTFSFRHAIAASHFVIANLSKGRLGAENSPVLGSLLFTKFQLDAMSQAVIKESERRLFTVYADELQNFVGQNFATLIAEARKYRISITAGHQSWRQLDPEMRNAMLGVGSRIFFRLHYHDARELAGELPAVSPQRLLTLPTGHAIFRSTNQLPIPFQVQAHRKPACSHTDVAKLRVASTKLYAAPRSAVRRDIDDRYHNLIQTYTSDFVDRPEVTP
jgi:GTPase SAR1 family protein